MAASLLVCDWGSTHLRAWALDERGTAVSHAEFPFGVNVIPRGEAPRRFRETVRPALGAEDLPALFCGAIGSNVGWRATPYVDCPAGLEDVAAGLSEVDARVWIAPGLRYHGPVGIDVLRGEETKALGWIGQGPARAEGRHLVCEPGTHPKWLEIEDGRVIRFLSAFTGELYAVLSSASILRSDGRVRDLAIFDQGLAAAADGDALLNRIYTARSRVAGAGAEQATTGSYLSGLLIGAETAATPRLLGLEGAPVVLLGEDPLRSLYARALARHGVAMALAEGGAAALAGLTAIGRLRGWLAAPA
jgi:2-dehydro-3-deoxygalactonokinase